jgi:hypothetical protein
VQTSGKLKYKTSVDVKTQVKTSKLIISSWGISQRIPASMSSEAGPSVVDAASESSGEPDTHPEPKKGKARYPKWRPSAPAASVN